MPEVTPAAATELAVPEGIVKARAAFLRDFPKLMADRKTRGKYVCYHNDELVAVAQDYWTVVDEAKRLKLTEFETMILRVRPGANQSMQDLIDEVDITR